MCGGLCVWCVLCAHVCTHVYVCVFASAAQVRVCKWCWWFVCCLHVFAVWLYPYACVHMYIHGVYCIQAHTYVQVYTHAHTCAHVPSGEERKDSGHTLVMVASPARSLLSISASPWLGSRMEGTQAQEGSWLRCLASCCDSLNGMDVMGGSLAR